MKINKDGKIEIEIDEIISSMSPEDIRIFVKSQVCSREVLNWVTNFLLGDDEDGWWGGEAELREKILFQIEQKHTEYVTQHNWSLIKAAADKLKSLESSKHIYWELYHHPNPNMSIADFILQKNIYDESEYSTKKADEKIQEVIDIVKEAVKPK